MSEAVRLPLMVSLSSTVTSASLPLLDTMVPVEHTALSPAVQVTLAELHGAVKVASAPTRVNLFSVPLKLFDCRTSLEKV